MRTLPEESPSEEAVDMEMSPEPPTEEAVLKFKEPEAAAGDRLTPLVVSIDPPAPLEPTPPLI
jgi:hypothetical protein